MRLQSHYNRISIISTLFILLIAAAGYYFLLRYVLINQLDETLKVEEAEIYDYINKYDQLPPATEYKDQRISFLPASGEVKRRFSSLRIVEKQGEKSELSRQLLFPVSVSGQSYIADVTVSEEETHDLVWIILLSTIALIILLFGILFFTNRFFIAKLWRPFRNTLASIKAFNLAAPEPIREQTTHITEFRELNESIRLMAQKVMQDYQSLKDFTDHASHEMQTPLAIINSKLDVLIQEPDLSEASMLQVQGIYKAVEKLSRLCQSLLLLARIENKQYTTTEPISITELLEEKANEMQEWIDAMNFKMVMNTAPLSVTMNRELAEILISNLLSNAVRHNEGSGSITIQSGKGKLSVSNSGLATLDKNRVFDRFYKSDQSGGSGLGLAIVKHICDQYHFKLDYAFSKGQHCFTVLFSA